MKRISIALTFLALIVSPRLVRAQITHVMTFAGDSIMVGTPGATAANCTVINRLGTNALRPSWIIRNYSYGGASVTGGLLFGIDVPPMNAAAVAESVGVDSGDAIVVFLGTNDWGYAVPLPTFTANYAAFIDGLGTAAKVICVTPIWRSNDGTANVAGYVLQDYRDAISAVCGARGDAVIDGLPLVPHVSTYFADGLHPNNTGYYYYANNLAAALDAVLQ